MSAPPPGGHGPPSTTPDGTPINPITGIAQRKVDTGPEMTDEEKEQLDTRAKRFGVDVEQCMYELYSEPDKQGKQVVAAKYKYVAILPHFCVDFETDQLAPQQGAFPDAYV